MEEQSQIEVLRKHCEYNGVPVGDTPEECVKNLSQTTRFKEEFAKSRDIRLTLKRMETDRKTDQSVTAFFIKNGSTRYNNDAKVWENVEGVQALMPNGRVFTLAGNELENGEPIKTRLEISPVTVTTNVLTGDLRISTPRDAAYKVGGDATAPLPDVDLEYSIAKCFKTSKRGTIFGNSGDFPVFATLTIGTDPSDVNYFGESDYGPASLTVQAFDSTGERGVQIKFVGERLDKVRQQFFIDEDADREEYEAALGGESIVVNGHIGVTFPMEPSRFGGTPEEGEQNFNEAITYLENLGLLGAYESNGERLQYLDLTKAAVDEDGSRPDHVEIDGKRCMNLQQERDKATGAIVWKASVHHDDVGKLPWMAVHTSQWTDKEGNLRYWNDGGFFLFPSRVGAATSNAGGMGSSVYDGLDQLALGDFSDASESGTTESAATAEVKVGA